MRSGSIAPVLGRSAAPAALARVSRAAGSCAELVRPRIGLFVVFSAFTGALLSAGPEAQLGRVLLAALLVGLVASASSVLNQVIERRTDALMTRTRNRPLPAGRVRVRDALLFGAALGVGGCLGLALLFGPRPALLALLTLLVYVAVYTPLKRRSSLNTLVGALAGAAPPLIGAAAFGGAAGTWGWTIYAVLFAWQFPHFLAIAWIHRADYRRAGLKMLPAIDGCEGAAGRQALVYCLLLLPLSLLPGAAGHAGLAYVVAALCLGMGFALTCFLFARRETPRRARAVLLASLAYLPLYLSLPLFDPVVSLTLRS